jgi:GT2 family glycosyltransferase
MKSTFAIGIPTLNQYSEDFKHYLLQYATVDFPNVELFIIDNGNQGIGLPGENVRVSVQEKNIGVAASWNKLCEDIFKEHDFAVILNDDIYWGTSEEKVSQFIEKIYTGQGNQVIVPPTQWCAFIMPKPAFRSIGKFDEEFFPAYFEDNDYAYRMKLGGWVLKHDDFLTPSLYKRSASLIKDPSINERFQINHEYFIKKWGGSPSKETFVVPFNHYPLTDSILIELGFERGWPETFKRRFGEGEEYINIEKENGKYRFLINRHYAYDNIEPWYRVLESKQDVQDLVKGLTGIKI